MGIVLNKGILVENLIFVVSKNNFLLIFIMYINRELYTLNIRDIIQSVFNVKNTDIELIPLKQGMTNDSFIFSINHERYIFRTPGINTDKLINRQQEFDVYQAIKGDEFIEPIIYIDKEKGYKISKFIENSHTVNPKDWNEISVCLKRLRDFHCQSHRVEHSFDVFEHINYYESLMPNASKYEDYRETKKNIESLEPIIENLVKDWNLCHIDAACDNFLVTENQDVYLIDFEYAAMQDPDLDLAMFIVYSLFNRQEIDRIIDIYFENQATLLKRYKIYSYIAIVGLLWSNWCEAKQDKELLNSSYAQQQYNYAKTFYQIVFNEARNLSEFRELVDSYA